MKKQTLVEWLEEFCLQLDEPEKPLFRTDYSQGVADGASDTQKLIAQKIRYAVEQEKARLTRRALDAAYCVCKKPNVYINRICKKCGKPHAPRK